MHCIRESELRVCFVTLHLRSLLMGFLIYMHFWLYFCNIRLYHYDKYRRIGTYTQCHYHAVDV